LTDLRGKGAEGIARYLKRFATDDQQVALTSGCLAC
jgi:hypothetical protein